MRNPLPGGPSLYSVILDRPRRFLMKFECESEEHAQELQVILARCSDWNVEDGGKGQ